VTPSFCSCPPLVIWQSPQETGFNENTPLLSWSGSLYPSFYPFFLRSTVPLLLLWKRSEGVKHLPECPTLLPLYCLNTPHPPFFSQSSLNFNFSLKIFLLFQCRRLPLALEISPVFPKDKHHLCRRSFSSTGVPRPFSPVLFCCLRSWMLSAV